MILSRRTPLPVADCCRLLGVSRSTAYREPAPAAPPDLELEALAGAHPRFGYRRLAALVGSTPKAMRSRMRRAGVAAVRRPRRRRTTIPALVGADNLCRTPGAPGQLLASDFTYVPLERGFLYFAVTLDVFSRRVRGFALSRRMDASLPIGALLMALDSGTLAPGWVHHSDRGCQYASGAFVQAVAAAGGRSSFSRPASPSENAFAESFFARFKDEVVQTREAMGFEEAAEQIRAYVDYYNRKRPHSSLGNHSPLDYESRHAEQALAVCVS